MLRKLHINPSRFFGVDPKWECRGLFMLHVFKDKCCILWYLLDITFSQVYLWYLYKYHKNSHEISEQISKLEFFLSRSYTGQVSGFSGESWRDQDGWTVCQYQTCTGITEFKALHPVWPWIFSGFFSSLYKLKTIGQEWIMLIYSLLDWCTRISSKKDFLA